MGCDWQRPWHPCCRLGRHATPTASARAPRPSYLRTDHCPLASEGSALTGTMAGAQGSMDIDNGKVEEGEASWTANMTSPMPMTLKFSATVEGTSSAAT